MKLYDTKSAFLKALANVPPEIKRYVQIQSDIAIRIFNILKNKGINKKEFATQLKMRESRLDDILAGNANLTLKTIAKIECALNENIINENIINNQ